jgi:predicted MFS family arabinose efflux permease
MTGIKLGRQPSFWIVSATLALFLFAAAAPSPLYAVYAARWHFSAVTLTAVFGVYAVALLVALLLTGSLSDSIGRRPVIFAALLIQLASLLLFLLASGAGWLFAARLVQGVATGVATSPLAAALVDLQPPEHPGLAPVVNSSAPILGLALGALGSAALVQYAPDPLHLTFWLMLGAFVAAAASILLIAEPNTRRSGVRLLPRVGVEPGARPEFIAALPSLVAGWAVGGFYLSLGPSVALQLAASSNRLLGGLAIFALAGVGAGSIIAGRSWAPDRSRRFGGIALIAGLALTVTAISLKAPTAFYAATALTGVGFGLSWLGVLRTLVALAAPTARGALLAAIFIVAYLAFAIPAVVAGYLVSRIGLHQAAIWYGGAVGVLAVAGLIGTLLVRRPVYGAAIVRVAGYETHER